MNREGKINTSPGLNECGLFFQTKQVYTTPRQMKTRATHILIALIVGVAIVIALFSHQQRDSENLRKTAGTIPSALEQEKGISEEHKGKLKLFILSGQSNMSGKGGLAPWTQQTNPNIYMFGNDYRWKLAVEPVDSPVGQIDKVSEDEGVGSGPSLAFASALLEKYPNMVIGLIPCARSGTSIDEWRRNLSVDSLYGSCLKRARIASRMGEISGLLFFQGEQDALDPLAYPNAMPHPENWGSEFKTFVESWRSDLNLPELPVVFAQIGQQKMPMDLPNWKVVQEQQRAVQLPFCEMITTDDLELKDELHFATKSYQIIGERFAAAYLKIMEEHVP
jgi:hypothetical protein